MIDEDAMSSTVRDTVLLKYVGMEPLIVHGGGPEISRSMDKLGKEPKFIKGLRVTDEETMEIIEMVLVGKISTDIVSQISYHDGKGISLSGKDSRLIFAHKKPVSKVTSESGGEEEIDLGLVGEIDCINTDLLEIHKQIAKLKEQTHVLARLKTKGFLDEAKYLEQTTELNSKTAKLQTEIKKLNVSDEEDETLEQLDMLIGYFEKRQKLMVEFEESAFESIVDKIVVKNQNELEFHLIGGLELAEEI